MLYLNRARGLKPLALTLLILIASTFQKLGVNDRTTVVSDISFSVGQSEIFGLIGPNGAGKTTTIRILYTVLETDRGDVTVES